MPRDTFEAGAGRCKLSTLAFGKLRASAPSVQGKPKPPGKK